MNSRVVSLIGLAACLFFSAPVLAYVGPGAGLSLLSALWGLLMAVLLAVGFVVMWPIKRWMKRRRTDSAEDDDADVALAGGHSRSGRDD